MSSCLALLTVTSTPDGPSLTSGTPWTVERADDLFAASVLLSRATPERSATETATGEAQPTSPGAVGSTASEPIVVARKPLAGTVAANVLAHGTGALNIDACRVSTGDKLGRTNADRDPDSAAAFLISDGRGGTFDHSDTAGGRWPANVVLDGDAADALDQQSGTSTSPGPYLQRSTSVGLYGPEKHHDRPSTHHGDSGGASRFYPVFRYQAKAPARERPSYTTEDGRKVAHPTVKPLELMRWLVRLVTPPGGTVVDPFAGSGTTGEAAWLEGFNSVLIENDPEAVPLIRQRMARLRGTA